MPLLESPANLDKHRTRASTRKLTPRSIIKSQTKTPRRTRRTIICDSDEDIEKQPAERRSALRKIEVDTSDTEEEGRIEIIKLKQRHAPGHDEEAVTTVGRKNLRKERSRTTDAELNHYSPVTPPKLKKGNDVENLLKSPPTPSSLFNKLTLCSPTKTVSSGDKFEGKRLFEDRTVYQNARRALHSTLPSKLPGREKELSTLREFVLGHLREEKSGSMYVSGPPGTGKTASLSTILKDCNVSSDFKEIYVNCTAIKSSGFIYNRIVKELNIKTGGKAEKDNLAAIENYLSKNHRMLLLVLDEIDQLESKKQSILYTIFEWPSRPNSKIILIGIANALDLTDRILPRLQARCELKPELMHFAPYSKQQIIEIFTERLREAGVLDVFSPVALQMLAGKVAAISGDVRRALDIGRRVVELVEQNKKQDVLKSLENLEQGVKPIEDAKPNSVQLTQVVNVLNSIYGTANNLTKDCDSSFPLQQKIVLCTLVLMLKKAKNKDVTIGKLHEVYRKVCVKHNLLAVDQAEFVGLCSLVETRGIIRVTGKKEPRLHKVSLEWDEGEVGAVLKDKQLMSSILQDDSCLGKL